jgi:hypothetical protein
MARGVYVKRKAWTVSKHRQAARKIIGRAVAFRCPWATSVDLSRKRGQLCRRALFFRHVRCESVEDRRYRKHRRKTPTTPPDDCCHQPPLRIPYLACCRDAALPARRRRQIFQPLHRLLSSLVHPKCKQPRHPPGLSKSGWIQGPQVFV